MAAQQLAVQLSSSLRSAALTVDEITEIASYEAPASAPSAGTEPEQETSEIAEIENCKTQSEIAQIGWPANLRSAQLNARLPR